MNTQGIEWENQINSNKLLKGYKEPKWGDSVLHERMMRIGIEYRIYSDNHPDDVERIARVTLREDFIGTSDKDTK